MAYTIEEFSEIIEKTKFESYEIESYKMERYDILMKVRLKKGKK